MKNVLVVLRIVILIQYIVLIMISMLVFVVNNQIHQVKRNVPSNLNIALKTLSILHINYLHVLRMIAQFKMHKL